MADAHAEAEGQGLVDRAVAEGGAYEVLHRRLQEQGRQLKDIADSLNAQRQDAFGSTRMDVVGRVRIRTENNCIARDIVQVGDALLFGYNVFLGLKKETRVEDVFSLYRLQAQEEGFEAEPVPMQDSFLAEASFVNDFNELYTYYKNTRLLQLIRKDGKLLASFQIGERVTDIRVFRWSVSQDGKQVRYIDNRGERDVALPQPFDFEWQKVTREMAVNGRHPHINILDTVFVETIGGQLTIKVENNTEDGQGIYREAVVDKTQSLDDAAIEFARVGTLVLLKILPYREDVWRYLVFNSLTRKVERIDAIGLACIQLPEDHGIIFPGGYYLQNGEYKTFDQSMAGMRFKRAVRSPNGEDVQYIFYHPEEGRSALFTYNLIRRELQNPVYGHGYARLEDGRMVIFAAEGSEPTRIHPMQIWQTPFFTDEYAARQPQRSDFFGKTGNAELVRGISELLNLSREIDSSEVSVQRYSRLCQDVRRLFDAYHWLDDPQCQGLGQLLHQVASTSELVLDEFEKVESIRQQSRRAMAEAETRHRSMLDSLRRDERRDVQDHVTALNGLTRLRGQLLTIRDYRYIDVPRIDAMEQELLAEQASLASATAEFLASDAALEPFAEALQQADQQAQQAETVLQLSEPLATFESMSADLDMLSSLMASLQIEDATQRTRIVDGISEIYARLNQAKARAEQRRRGLGSAEQVAQFGAQFRLFGQGITSALAQARDPEACDVQLSRLLVQLEELESQFGDHEQFLGDILAKREELLETFETHRQALLDERQRRAQGLLDAAVRIIDSLPRRTARLTSAEEMNAFFVADPLILKLRELTERLRELQDNVKADDVEARLKNNRDQAIRGLRDKTELFEEGGNIIRLGPRHRFSVNTQELDLTLMPRGDQLYIHLTGTDFLEPLRHPELEALKPYWQAGLESESAELYRAEYLAGEVLAAAEAGRDGLSPGRLHELMLQPEQLVRAIRDFATPRYREGYEKGIHDHDASLILAHLLPLRESAGLLSYSPQPRALALLFEAQYPEQVTAGQWPQRGRAAAHIAKLFGRQDALQQLQKEVAGALVHFAEDLGLQNMPTAEAAEYLVAALAAGQQQPVVSKYAAQLLEALQARLQAAELWDEYLQTLAQLSERTGEQWRLVENWLHGLCSEPEFEGLRHYLPEAVALALLPAERLVTVAQVDLRFEVSGLLGDHPRIDNGQMTLALDDLFARLRAHRNDYLPGLQRYQALRQEVINEQRDALRLSEFKARPLSSFVRNRLINDVYLGVIGDNLAKQMGTAGENRRSDLTGLLMLISPPGYGKTTLMEYVAHRLGLVFMKINGPSLGHEVRSLDPEQAPDATSAQELVKLNLALEMGNNVMLYVDDIQHTHPEFLQKFISLCDGTRRIEGVWKGRTRTYDMRGRKFCVVMAGNPYTESGEVFKIPDMLANRADIYNLGDTLGGMQDIFALSYIENCLTSNPVLAPLATRDMQDLYRFVAKAEGKPFSSNELSHDYSGAEVNEIVSTLERLMQVRDVVFRVNQQYIASAAQDDRYRTEPPFRLQGSYRNMNKLAEKISSVMNQDELLQLIADHYQGESQLLTTGAEENMLKLAELRGNMTPEQQSRWAQIKADFMRNKAMGGDDTDVGNRVVVQLNDLVESIRALGSAAQRPAELGLGDVPWQELVAGIESLHKLSPQVKVVMPPPAAMKKMLGDLAENVQASLKPLVDVMDRKTDIELCTQSRLIDIAERVRELGTSPARQSPLD
jgi:MoxR-like ATPase